METTMGCAVAKERTFPVSGRILSLAILFAVFEGITYFTSFTMPHLDGTTWAMLAIAGSYGGRCIAYMVIGEPFRFLFTKVVPHSSGAGESVEPKWTEGFMAGIAILFACPICAGAWMTLGILFLMTFIPHMGMAMLYIFSAAGVGWFLTRFTELLEAGRHLLDELNGHWNRQNKEEQRGRK